MPRRECRNEPGRGRLISRRDTTGKDGPGPEVGGRGLGCGEAWGDAGRSRGFASGPGPSDQGAARPSIAPRVEAARMPSLACESIASSRR